MGEMTGPPKCPVEGKSGLSLAGAKHSIRKAKEDGEHLHKYLCPHCHKWHLGHGLIGRKH